MPAESLRSERDQAPLTIADDPVPASKTDDPVFGDQINEGDDFEQSFSDLSLEWLTFKKEVRRTVHRYNMEGPRNRLQIRNTVSFKRFSGVTDWSKMVHQ